ncbi:hypothetical protein CFP56_018787 [Quercus suber]|uniref:Uncharacterized protein n=1 Tax=Quercus suber TaxID=58331 RepID=A0AAW0KM24_QUESU
MSNFKDQALFLGFSKNSRFSSITRSNGSQQSSNCTNSFGLEGDYILLEMLDGRNHECSRLPFMRRKYIQSLVWKTSHDFFLFTIPTIHVLNE